MGYFHLVLLVTLSVASAIPGKKGQNNNNQEQDTEAEDEAEDTSSDSAYATTVKALIAAGECEAVSTTDNCEDSATGYYETFEYNSTHRVIIVSGAPNHAAETDLFISEADGGFLNPNRRCEIWQYSVVPLNPEINSTTDWSNYNNYPYYDMGVYGYATSGGTFFDTRSSPQGDTAWDNEIETLDTCMGHSNGDMQYHYHGVPYCLPEDTWAADDPTQCQFVGYMLDGFPVYGRCQHTNGAELESCWVANTDDPGHLEDYSYVDGDSCYLDEANGYEFTTGQTSDGYTGYGYVTTTGFSGVPIGFMGTEFGEICGFTPE